MLGTNHSDFVVLSEAGGLDIEENTLVFHLASRLPLLVL